MARNVRILLTFALVLLLNQAAVATVIHGDFSGTNVDFLGVQETSNPGDPEPLYGAPIVLGDSLLFFPAAFTASASGGVADPSNATGSQLQATLMATGGSFLTTVTINEFGDTTLTGLGTAATGTFVSMSGFITVLEVNGAGVAPTIIPIPVDQAFFLLTTDPGTTNWSLTTTVDIAALVPNATKAFLSFDNNLTSASEAGTDALIQKKVLSGPSIVVTVPEPALFALLGAASLAWVARRGR